MAISDERILEAAVAVIAERGYANATTKQIAARANINEVTLFRRFGSKKNLLRSVIEYEAAKFADGNLKYTGELEADLVRIVERYQALVARRGHIMMMVLTEIRQQPDLIDLLQAPQAQMQRVAGILARYQAEGRLIKVSPFLALVGLVAPIFLTGTVGHLEFGLTNDLLKAEELVERFLQGHQGDTAYGPQNRRDG